MTHRIFLLCVVLLIAASACSTNAAAPAQSQKQPTTNVDDLPIPSATALGNQSFENLQAVNTRQDHGQAGTTAEPTMADLPRSVSRLPSWTPNGPTVSPFPTLTPYNTLNPSQTAQASPTPATEYELNGEHFWLARPFLTNSGIQASVNAYAYGTTTFGYRPHHGVDIENPIGTNVRAVASGTVFYAGDDLNEVLFGPETNFYGNLVVIEHVVSPPDTEGTFTFYTLYGHLSQFFVRAGDEVQQFDEIGAVGQEGVALGPHLHLEVRIGDPYDYNSTYNPNLWLQPFPGSGVIAGRVFLRTGGFLTDVEVEAQQNGRLIRSTLTYHYDLVRSDPFFQENFVIPDLPAGIYDVVVKYQGRAYTQQVEVLPGRVSGMNQVLD